MSILLEINSDYLAELLLQTILLDTPDKLETVEFNGAQLLETHSALHPIGIAELLVFLQAKGYISLNVGDVLIKQIVSHEGLVQGIEKLNIKRLNNPLRSDASNGIVELDTPNSSLRIGLYSFMLFHCCQALVQHQCDKHGLQFNPTYSRAGVLNQFPRHTTLLDLNEVINRVLFRLANFTDYSELDFDALADYLVSYIRLQMHSGFTPSPNPKLIKKSTLIHFILCDALHFGYHTEQSTWLTEPL